MFPQKKTDFSTLQQSLDGLYVTFQTDYLSMDPLELVRQYADPADQEIAAFIAAGLAIGQVDLIRRAVHSVLEKMQPSPSRFIRHFHPAREPALFRDFVYRFYRGGDIRLLLWWMAQMVSQSGSLGAFFREGYHAEDADIGPSLSRFVQAVFSLNTEPVRPDLPRKGSGIRHFLADPADGSACKRLNLFLRWMVRRDALDLGLWNFIAPSQLVIPLDTHIARFGRCLGLTRRKSPDWRMAAEITGSLRRFDPDDPVKYDFAICTLGKMSDCAGVPDPVKCTMCPVFRFCSPV